MKRIIPSRHVGIMIFISRSQRRDGQQGNEVFAMYGGGRNMVT